METRIWVAYGLITVLLVVGTAFAVVSTRRRAARKRRLRGIKDDQRSDPARSLAA